MNQRALVAGLVLAASVPLARGEEAKGVAVPPPLTKRTIAPSTNAPLGETIPLADQGVGFTLFLPPGWAAGTTVVSAHFHGATWFVIQEHLRRSSRDPLICFQLGEGSTVYRQAFEDTNRFGRILHLVEEQLAKRGATSGHITAVDVSSFSAGYGAVRELVKSPAYFQVIRRIVLLDSMYAGFESPPAEANPRKPAAAQIEVWAPFARAAVAGEKTFLFTHSEVPTASYASSGECAAGLLELLGVQSRPVAPGSLPATLDPEFPLRARADAGRLHVWSYGGEDAQAHMTHPRHMADLWRALDVAEAASAR